MKTLVILISCLLLATVQSAPTESDAPKSNTYSVKITDNGVEKEEEITLDEEKNVEIFKTVDSDDAEIIEDFDAGIEAIVPADGPCYVKPLKSDESVPPAQLKTDIENAKETTQEAEEKPDDYYTLAGTPVKNRAVVGETIGAKCEGRDIYWLASVPHGDESRDKRGCYWYRYCRYYYYRCGWGLCWYRHCWYIVRCYY